MPAPSRSGAGISATASSMGIGMAIGAAGGASVPSIGPSIEEGRERGEFSGPGMFMHDWVLQSDTYESGAGTLPGRDPDPAVANGAAILALSGVCIAAIPAPRAAMHPVLHSAHSGGGTADAVGYALSADFVVTQHVVWQERSVDATLLRGDAESEEMAVHRIVLRGNSLVHPSVSGSSAEKPSPTVERPSLHVVC